MRVFISHSDDDVEIAKPLITLLRSALNLRSNDIRCSSVDGYRLPAGASSDEVLRREVHDAELLVGLITPNSITSVYVLFELGARWGAGKPMYPLLAAGATWEHLEGPLSGINALDCSNASQVIQFVENAAEALGTNGGSASAYVDSVFELVKSSSGDEPVEAPSPRRKAFENSDNSTTTPPVTSVRPALSKEAERLLGEASKDNAGPIRKLRSAGGTWVFTQRTSFAEPGDPRSEALWNAAIRELINHDLVRDPTGNDKMFELTHKGFLVADELRASRSSE